KYFEKLSAYKNFDRDIISPVKYMADMTRRGMKYSRVKCTTQFIVGAADEPDIEIVRYMDGIYNRLNFERVYFSAYQPGLGDRSIPGEQSFELRPDDRFTREHRLYQVDFLMRSYGFSRDELIFRADGNLALDKDPKQIWADNHPELFPLNVNSVDREALLRVPGIGPASADKIIKSRRVHQLRDLSDVGIKGKLREKAQNYLVFR
ncbi:MAG: helix-hairpin-helix domain-containing protein, partial [Victivallales bacterium]|nr:helix-hairpin-helix domain-containing protein [Victivallales bacterium]